MKTSWWLVTAAWIAAAPVVARAALGPENVFVVANASDSGSVTIAREYARLRQVPVSNVMHLRGVPARDTISLADFRAAILNPILAEIRARGLTRQIGCIAYSSGFPYAVDVSAAMAGRSFPRYITQPASLTGLTYLHELLGSEEPDFLAMDANRYYRGMRRPSRPWPYSRDDAAARAELDALAAEVSRLQDRTKAEPPPEVQKSLTHALEIGRGLAARHADDATLMYDLACLYALSGRPDDATRSLRSAAAAGWMNVSHTERDPDLTPLRGREDFKALLAGMRSARPPVDPSRPFEPGSRWDDAGLPSRAPAGRTYMLACMLAYVGPAANTMEEALSSLRRSAGADFRRPRGTVYFMASSDVARTGPRQWAFEHAKAALARLGVRSEILSGFLPTERDDVAGAVIGAATVDWKSSRSRILPGAFCDHLTSLAGVMRGGGQTLLSEWIRHGAAGSSGTVTEPYNLAAKFPSAFLHVFYAQGCTLAEAFYQSVAGPYQQLLVADPLCAPWARPISVRVAGIKPNTPVTRPMQLKVSVAGAKPVRRVDLFIDGRLVSSAAPGKPVRLNPAGLSAGTHEARVVGIAGDQNWRGRATFRFTVPAGAQPTHQRRPL